MLGSRTDAKNNPVAFLSTKQHNKKQKQKQPYKFYDGSCLGFGLRSASASALNRISTNPNVQKTPKFNRSSNR